MLEALLRRKLEGEFVRDCTSIEDLLTGTVLAACQYLAPEQALLPFLAHARDKTGRRLGELLQLEAGTEVKYWFWPRWDDAEVDGVHVAGGEPDVVVEIRSAGRWSWVVVEAKLGSGKSSFADPGPVVTDQLAKYAAQLLLRASQAGAHPMALIYLTASGGMPLDDIAESERELVSKAPALNTPPLFWLSWRHFVPTTLCPKPPLLLQHIHEAMAELWGFDHLEIAAWPVHVPLSAAWQFTRRWNWPERAATARCWKFEGAP